MSKYPTKKRLSKEDVDAEIKKALEVWSEFTGLNFEEKSSGQVHIDIRYLWCFKSLKSIDIQIVMRDAFGFILRCLNWIKDLK